MLQSLSPTATAFLVSCGMSRASQNSLQFANHLREETRRVHTHVTMDIDAFLTVHTYEVTRDKAYVQRRCSDGGASARETKKREIGRLD